MTILEHDYDSPYEETDLSRNVNKKEFDVIKQRRNLKSTVIVEKERTSSYPRVQISHYDLFVFFCTDF